MSLPTNVVVLATICNTIGDASPYALWCSDGERQYVVDLSDHVRGASGLTGIAYYRRRIYVAVQTLSSQILVLDMALNVVDVITSDDFCDVHSLHIAGDALFIASTRNGKLLKHDLANGSTTVIATFDPEAWACAVLYQPDDIWLCCHHLRYLDPAAEGGGVFSVTQGRVVLDRLLRPHSLMVCSDGFMILDSGNSRVVHFDKNGIIQDWRLQGFLRGAALAGEDTLLVAGGPHRTMSRKNPAGVASRSLRDVAHERLQIFELDRGMHTQTHLPELPGFEIYDLLALPSDVALNPEEHRIVRTEQGSFARFYYVTLVDALFRLSALQA